MTDLDALQPLSPLWAGRLHLMLELMATLAFALSGVLEAARKRLDMVGVVVVAFAAAFGGGTLRDLLLDHRPFFWVQDTFFLWLVIVVCAAAMLFMRQRHLQPTERAIVWPDAIGLGLFTVIGEERALALGQPALVAVMMGVITSVFGGVLRDVLCNEVPRALADHRPYALWICSRSCTDSKVRDAVRRVGSPLRPARQSTMSWTILTILRIITANGDEKIYHNNGAGSNCAFQHFMQQR